jgi:hypothetical protein
MQNHKGGGCAAKQWVNICCENPNNCANKQLSSLCQKQEQTNCTIWIETEWESNQGGKLARLSNEIGFLYNCAAGICSRTLINAESLLRDGRLEGAGTKVFSAKTLN